MRLKWRHSGNSNVASRGNIFFPPLRAKFVVMVQIKETLIVKVHRHYLLRYKLGV